MLFSRKITAMFFVFFIFSSQLFSGMDSVDNENIPIPVISSKDSAIVPVSRTPKWWLKRHNNRLNPENNQKIIFIGDSITHGWEDTALWPLMKGMFKNKITNLGFSGDHTQHVIWRMENGEFPPGINPEYVVLMIGTNNHQKPESIAAGIGKIIKIINKKSPSTKIILLSLLPCGSGNTDENTIKNNAVNEIIKKYDGFLNVKYLNIGKYYIGNDGSLKEELFSDRLHLSLEGYKIWMVKLLEVIK